MFRWFALAVLVGCLSISVYYRRRARMEGETIPRRRETPLLLAGRAFVALPLLVAIVTYLVEPSWMAWAELPLPNWARWAGVVLGLLTVPAARWVFTSLGRNISETVLTKRHHVLVTAGPYRWIRHPLYTTGIALVLAIGLMAASWLILLFGVVTLAAIRFVVIPLEERELVMKFGDEYRAYMRRTGRLLPRGVGGGGRGLRTLRTLVCTGAFSGALVATSAAQLATVGAGVLLSDRSPHPAAELHVESPAVYRARAYATVSWTDESAKPTVITAGERSVWHVDRAFVGMGVGLLWLEVHRYRPRPMLVSSAVVPLPIRRVSVVGIASTLPLHEFEWSLLLKVGVTVWFVR